VIRPFHEVDGCFESVDQPELKGFVRVAEPVEITVPDLACVTIISLHKRECGRRDVGLGAAKGADDRPREKGFSSPDVAGKQNHVTGPQKPGEGFAEPGGFRLGPE
jgi:hypothetical protein